MHFWHGIIEDRNDPYELGRHRVRVIGKHTANKEELPTETLPWAMCLTSTNSNSNSGVNGSIPSLPPGTRVVVYYEDEGEDQIPLIIGVVPSIHNEQSEETQDAFSDEETQNGFAPELEELETTPQEVENVVVIPGESALVVNKLKEKYPRKKYINRSSSSIIATNPSDTENDKINRKRNTPDNGGNLSKGVRMAFFDYEPYEVAPQRKTNSPKGEFHDYSEKLKSFLSTSTFNKFPPALKEKKDSNNDCIYTPEFKDYGQEQFINSLINNFDNWFDNLLTSKEELWEQNPGLRTYRDI